jgi:hypothetical protein
MVETLLENEMVSKNEPYHLTSKRFCQDNIGHNLLFLLILLPDLFYGEGVLSSGSDTALSSEKTFLK